MALSVDRQGHKKQARLTFAKLSFGRALFYFFINTQHLKVMGKTKYLLTPSTDWSIVLFMNTLAEVEALAKSLMTEHGVGYLNFRFSKATKCIAAVRGRYVLSQGSRTAVPYEICFSRRWATVLPKKELWEVLIHEIAHVKAGYDVAPHGKEFKAIVRSLGGIASERCFTPSVRIDGSPRS